MTSAISTPTARIRIREAAVELMGRKGIAGTTTQDIARRAHCSQAAIYKYWDSKEALAEEQFSQSHDRLLEAMEQEARGGGLPVERILRALHGFVRFAREHPADYAFLFHVFHSDYARWLTSHRKPRDLVLREIEAAVEAGDLPRGDPGLKAAMILGMAIRVAFFERQKLLGAEGEAVDRALREGALAVLNLSW